MNLKAVTFATIVVLLYAFPIVGTQQTRKRMSRQAATENINMNSSDLVPDITHWVKDSAAQHSGGSWSDMKSEAPPEWDRWAEWRMWYEWTKWSEWNTWKEWIIWDQWRQWTNWYNWESGNDNEWDDWQKGTNDARTGRTAGIVVGVLAMVIIIFVVPVAIICKHRNKSRPSTGNHSLWGHDGTYVNAHRHRQSDLDNQNETDYQTHDLSVDSSRHGHFQNVDVHSQPIQYISPDHYEERSVDHPHFNQERLHPPSNPQDPDEAMDPPSYAEAIDSDIYIRPVPDSYSRQSIGANNEYQSTQRNNGNGDDVLPPPYRPDYPTVTANSLSVSNLEPIQDTSSEVMSASRINNFTRSYEELDNVADNREPDDIQEPIGNGAQDYLYNNEDDDLDSMHSSTVQIGDEFVRASRV